MSVHINQWGIVDDREGSLEYLRAQEPIGARDTMTLEKLLERNISAYFSACLTLTWDPNIRLRSPQPRSQVLVIDSVGYTLATLVNLVPEEILKSCKAYSVNLAYVDNQGVHSRPTFHQPFQFAYGNLLQIARAKLVITSRIHVALPCVALGTPVIFTLIDGAHPDSGLPGGGGGRVDGLRELFHLAFRNTMDNSWRFDPDFDWENPPPNPSSDLRQRLVANLWSRIRRELLFADTARMFGLFPRQPSQPLDGDKVQVVEGEGVAPLLTLRTLESVLFHHPRSSVILIRVSEEGSWGDLEEEVHALQEGGYSIEVLIKAPDLQPNAWRIYSPTILLKKVPDDEKVFFQNYAEVEHRNANVLPLSEVSGFCEEERREGLDNLTGVRMDIGLGSIKNSSSKSLCRKILNENCILSNIIV